MLAASAGLSLEIVVVDNASVDGSAAAIKAEFPEITLIPLARNVGFAAACNVGAAAGDSERILLLNPDTEMRAGCIEALIELLERRPDAGVVGGRTVDENGVVDPRSCWGLPSLWSMFCFATGLSTVFARSKRFDPESLGRWPRDSEREVGVVTGCLLMCTRELWDRLGGMDTTYFVYGEDVDFSYRARQLGARPRITPAAEVIHIVGAASASSAAKWVMILRGEVTFMRRCWGGWPSRAGIVLLHCGTLLRAFATRFGVSANGPWRENWSARHDWAGGWEAFDKVSVDYITLD